MVMILRRFGRSSARREAETYRSPYELWKDGEDSDTIGGIRRKRSPRDDLKSPGPREGGVCIHQILMKTGGFNDTLCL